jgi:hypothetical protein
MLYVLYSVEHRQGIPGCPQAAGGIRPGRFRETRRSLRAAQDVWDPALSSVGKWYEQAER